MVRRLASMSDWVSQSSRKVGRARWWPRQLGWIPYQYPSAGLVFRKHCYQQELPTHVRRIGSHLRPQRARSLG
jgi:hypothetical protein